ncbi:MAG: site-2 protease family protein [Candidatus Omnitrophota bacterium]|nr:MAG: site-2 protease family protein [Candidatus Omnitrophota bacterium]
MRGSIRLFKVADISINIHITFFLLLLLFLNMGVKWLFLIVAIFFFVTLHELSHSLVAKKFGIRVKEITLLPIGGVASMTKMPDKPYQEFLISLAGPMLNIAVVIIFFLPLYYILGPEVLFHPLSVKTFPLTIAHIYWINLILAIFNLIPAFPMDGGRIVRALLAGKLGYQKATKIAVNFGHIFALLFGYIGLINGHILLIIIAVFIYMAASSEELQVDLRETLKKFTIKDIVPSQFLTLQKEATLSKVLELMFHSHQEDFPVIEGGRMVGFITRSDIINGIHQHGVSANVSLVMKKDFPVLQERDHLDKVQNIMQENNIKALPVVRDDSVIGVVTIEDVTRVYSLMSKR